MFFFRKSTRSDYLVGDTLGQRRLRRILWVLLLAVVATAFWANGEKRFGKILGENRRGVRVADSMSTFVKDETGLLSVQQLKALEDYAEKFEARYGVRFLLKVVDESPVDEGQAGLFYFALSPEKEEVLVNAPSLLAGILGKRLLDDIEQEHFKPYFERGDWQAGLVDALNKITDKLEAGMGE